MIHVDFALHCVSLAADTRVSDQVTDPILGWGVGWGKGARRQGGVQVGATEWEVIISMVVGTTRVDEFMYMFL